jgi:predicted aconitase/predicted aconitase with swiveling domain
MTEAGSIDVTIVGRALVAGGAEGMLIRSDTGLSFWGGVDAQSGMVIDRHHPLHGQCVAGRVLAIPSGRGSCSGSGVLLELILNGHAPAAIIVSEPEEILTLGALVAELMFGQIMPVLQLDRMDFARLSTGGHARIERERVEIFPKAPADGWQPIPAQADAIDPHAAIRLSDADHAFLDGQHGKAAAFAMRLLLRMAALQGAETLIDIAQVHVDGCVYTGRAGLDFAETLVAWGARVRVPTTLNAISVDRRRWQAMGIDPALGVPAAALGDAYLAMGARPSFTCAPYLLDSAPGPGEQIGWAESNAVVYANSVIGARTMKYPDFLDICVALTGRAPLAGCHLDAGRQAVLALDVPWPEDADDAFWPILGYCCGLVCGGDIPLIRGLEGSSAGLDALKAFGAAFATTAAAPMFHIAGITPEAAGQNPERSARLDMSALRQGWQALNSSDALDIGLVSLGSPHVSLAECAHLAELVPGRTRAPEVSIVVTCGREVHEAAARAGYVAPSEAFGVRFVTDTCWCMLGEPVVPPHVQTLMTNSAKYAHYAPGLVGRLVRFGSLGDCIEAACTGRAEPALPVWLR